jgi:hypothetical protein
MELPWNIDKFTAIYEIAVNSEGLVLIGVLKYYKKVFRKIRSACRNPYALLFNTIGNEEWFA